ncbi:MAG: lipopolysaccharide biosynthesis protein [Clostridiales bacterium]|nr:lipopolysaccharide biosynthesis protein [Clostridiales bacterium]
MGGKKGQLKTQTLSNMVWRFAERCGAQGVSFVVSLVLARLLDPDVYGTVALVTVFTAILQVFVDSGLGTALIQKKDADQLDFSTVFYFNMGMCLALYAILFAAAPWIASFYGDDSLCAVVRVLGLTLIISGMKNIQQAYVSRHLIFRRFFYATLGGTIVSAVVGIAMAYAGFGVWALVAQRLTNSAMDTLILFFTVRWRPTREWSFQRFKGLFAFGWKLLLSSLLDTVFNNLWQLIIGKKYSSTDLAYYNKGDNFPKLLITNINSAIDSVLLPVMSSVQSETERVKAITRRAIEVSTYVMAPLMVGLAAVAEPLIRLLLTEKWLPCVFFLRMACVAYLVYPIHTANLNAIKALGRSDLFLKLEVIKKGIALAFLLVTMWFGVKVMMRGVVIASLLSVVVNAYPNKQLMNYSLGEQMKDILPHIMMAVAMGIPVYCLSFLPLPTICVLLVQVLCGAVIYIGLSVLLHVEMFYYILNMLRGYRK